MPKQNSTVDEKLSSLRAEFNTLGVDGFIIPRSDEYQGEYVPPCAERLRFMTGFTGSAGRAIVLDDKAVVMSDGRYTNQLKQQVDQNYYDLANSMDVSAGDWLSDNAKNNAVIGYDPRLHTPKEIEAIEGRIAAQGMTLKALAYNPVDQIWDDQPDAPKGDVSLFPEHVAGKTAAEKKKMIMDGLKEEGAAGCIITLPDSICWLLNVRGSDIAYIPVALSVMIASVQDERLEWYIDDEKLPADVKAHLKGIVDFCDPANLDQGLQNLAAVGKADEAPVLMDMQRSAVFYKDTLERAGAVVKDAIDPCIDPRAQKSVSEMDAIRQAHIEDGVAMVKFLRWLDENARGFTLDELKVADQLEAFRKQNANYKEPSFATISAFADSAASPHYHATPEKYSKIDKDGLLLVDSGGQYAWGTTDITRTVAVGTPSAEEKESFTQVLKSHIALARQKFPKGTTGAQIDAITRANLWAVGKDFAHGTGHGVGCYLSVHEEATSISGASKKAALKEGMLVSNEPGFYKEGAYGIRIENLVLVRDTGLKSEGRNQLMYEFETVTMAPMDRNLIDVDMLSDAEREWLNTYHKTVRDTLSPLLGQDDQMWLDQVTAPVLP